jgi:hypothetical protein
MGAPSPCTHCRCGPALCGTSLCGFKCRVCCMCWPLVRAVVMFGGVAPSSACNLPPLPPPPSLWLGSQVATWFLFPTFSAFYGAIFMAYFQYEDGALIPLVVVRGPGRVGFAAFGFLERGGWVMVVVGGVPPQLLDGAWHCALICVPQGLCLPLCCLF